ncbi:MAG: CRISPR-associated endoribonuclease Cas6 [Chloroflexi bacterium]|nr:CRISPR-associated endoribonuclease Cas6 [Chloroflexota bacterium]
MTPQLHRLTFTLALESWRGPSRDLYGPGHALLLDLLRRGDAATAGEVHDADRRKPFALSRLHVEGIGQGAATAHLTVNLWDAGLAGTLERGLEAALEVRAWVRGASAILVRVDRSASAPLPAIADGPEPRSIQVRFASPTFFSLGRRGGRQSYCLLPVPELVVRSWLRPWLEAGGVVPDDPLAPGWLADRVAIRRVRDLSTVAVDSVKTALTGFTGDVSYAWTGAEPWGPGLLDALARFAEYCGTGAKTGHGFGETCVLGLSRAASGGDNGSHGGEL